MVIEAEIGINLKTDKDGTTRWYQIVSISRSRLRLEFEELRYLAICRDYVKERIWAENQKITELEDDGIILEITTRSEPELTAWVRSFGDDATFLNE